MSIVESYYPRETGAWRCELCGGDKVRHSPYCSASSVGGMDETDKLKAELLLVLDDREELKKDLDVLRFDLDKALTVLRLVRDHHVVEGLYPCEICRLGVDECLAALANKTEVEK